MSAPIGPGDWVECVNATPCPLYGPCGLSKGGVYQVEDVLLRQPCVSGWALLLVGHRGAGPLGGFGAHRFRPIYPGGELKRLLLEKPLEVSPPEKVKADA